MSEEAFMELALELGAEDVSVDEDVYEIVTAVADFNGIREELERREVPLAVKQLSMVPQTTVEVDPDNAPKLMQLIEALEDQDDVQNVWANFEATESIMAEA
jgi:transcriptional/translational regulatory protein YebC/TACO1